METSLASLPIGPIVTDPIRAPRLHDPRETTNLIINFNNGNLNITPGAKDIVVDGAANYNVANLKPQIILKRNEITIEQEGHLDVRNIFNSAVTNEWNLKLGDMPLALNLKTDIAMGKIELGGLSLVDLNVTQGASSFEMSFSQPNRVEMNELNFHAGASSATLTGLNNANARRISFTGGGDSYTLNFGGKLQRETEVSVETDLGETTIIVPPGIPARVSVGAENNEDITAAGAWQKSGNDYILPGEGPQLNITVAMGSSNLILRNQ